MHRLVRGLALVGIAAIAVACGGGGSTQAPASPAASPAGSPAGSPSAGLAVVAKDTAFNPTSLSAKAATPFTIDFDNQDSFPHNIAIKDAGGTTQFKGEIITGAKATYNVPALPAGTYAFWCEVHPNMTGTLTVQ
jgi:plastocyanin